MTGAPAVLHLYPGALDLPTADPQALAVETTLRFLQVRYVKKDAAMRDLRLIISPTPAKARAGRTPTTPRASTPITYHGFRNCMRYLSALLDADVVQSDHKHVVACVEWIATKCLFPAFTFLIHFEPNLFHYGLRKTLVPKVATLWERLSGTYQENVLRSNMYAYPSMGSSGGGCVPQGSSLSAAGMDRVGEVLEEVEKAFRALELLHLSYAQTDETFFSGTMSPCSVDAYVYAGVSSFLHADFGGLYGSARLAVFQATVKEECPHLVRYVEWMRQMFYEEYSGRYSLKQPEATPLLVMEAAVTEAMYSRGRTKVLFLTGLFTFVYFLFANFGTVLSVLEEISDSDKDDMTDSASEEGKEK